MGRHRTKHSHPPGERYVALYRYVLETAAFRALSGNACKLLVLVAIRHDGHNNGRISFSVREAAEQVGCAINTAARLFSELQDKGFLELNERGSFTRKNRHASTWRVTFFPSRDDHGSPQRGDRPFTRWMPATNSNLEC